MSTNHVVIIGGGISGLTAAFWLKQNGVPVTVLERDAVPGGTMRTMQDGGWMIETGPNSALETTPVFGQMFDLLGLTRDRLYADAASNNRYILRNGRLHALPMSPPAFLRSRLWTVPGKLRLLKEPFVGRAGQLLNKILAAISLKREEVYIANILKCRPPNNRTPIPEEVAACMPFLKKQIALVKPQIIVCLGLTAAQNLLGISESLGKLRGRMLTFADTPLLVTYHPAALLRNPNWKPAAWEDFQAVQKFLAEHAGDVKEGPSVG